MISAWVVNDDQIRSLESQRADLSTEYASLSQRFMDDYPAVVELRSRMDEIDAQIAERRESIINDVLSEYRNLEAEVTALQERDQRSRGWHSRPEPAGCAIQYSAGASSRPTASYMTACSSV